MCRIGVKYQYTIRAVCSSAYVFRKDRGVRLLEHVRSLEQIQYIISQGNLTDKNFLPTAYEPHHEKNRFLPVRKQSRSSAKQLLHS